LERLILARTLVHLPVIAALTLAVWALAVGPPITATLSAPQAASAPIRASLRPSPLPRVETFIPDQIGPQIRMHRSE
jgi:hypothetical protein